MMEKEGGRIEKTKERIEKTNTPFFKKTGKSERPFSPNLSFRFLKKGRSVFNY